MNKQRSTIRRADDYFFVTMASWIIVVVVGFWHSYFQSGALFAKLPSLLVHVHGALFSLWLVLLIIQIALVSRSRIHAHRQLGVLGMVIAGLMIAVGLPTLFAAEHRRTLPDPIFTFDLLTLIVFGLLFSGSFFVRGHEAQHKRLIFLATLAISVQGLGRWPFAFIASDVVFYSILNLPLLFLVLFDLLTLRKVSWATVLGIFILAGVQITFTPFSHTTLIHQLIARLQK